MSGPLGGKRVGVIDPIGSFTGDLVSHWRESNEVSVIGSEKIDPGKIIEVCNWADVVWAEWCGDHVVILSRMAGRACPVVARLHSFEVMTELPWMVDWANISRTVFVAGHIRRFLGEKGVSPPRSVVIPNGLDISKFPVPNWGRDMSRIALMGQLIPRKLPALALQVCGEIVRRGYGATLVQIGDPGDEWQKHSLPYMADDLGVHLEVHGKVGREDAIALLRTCGFVLSTSMWESFHYSIAEGALSGCIPLIYNWYGAKDVWPRGFVFSLVRDAADMYEEFVGMPPDSIDAVRVDYRKFVADNYSLDKQLAATDNLMAEVLREQKRAGRRARS